MQLSVAHPTLLIPPQQDNIVANIMLSDRTKIDVTNFFVKQAKRLAIEEGHAATERAKELSGDDRIKVLPKVRMASHKYEAIVRFFITMFALNIGFFRVTRFGSNVSCEMLAYYFYYRTSLRIATWGNYFVQDTIILIAAVHERWTLFRTQQRARAVRFQDYLRAHRRAANITPADVSKLSKVSEAAPGETSPSVVAARVEAEVSHGVAEISHLARKYLLPLLITFVEGFIETLACAIVMNIFFWLCCSRRVRFQPRHV